MLIKFLRKIIGYDDLLLRNGYLVEEIESMNLVIKRAMKDCEELSEEYEELENKYELSKQKLNELLKKKTINILELRNWYEGRRMQRPWLYNGNRLGRVDVSKYLIPKDIKPFTELASNLILKYNLTRYSTPTDVVSAMYKYWNLRSSWKYRTDQSLFGKVEYWEDPTDALKRRVGDCESKSMAMLNTTTEMLRLLDMSEHEWRLTFIASLVAGEGGHGYLTWLHDDGEYYVIESTYYNNSSMHKTWLKTPMRFNNLYQTPWGFATKTRSWSGSNSALLSFREV